MDFAFNPRMKIIAGVAVLGLLGAGACYYFLQDEAPPPRSATPAKPAADAPKAMAKAKPPEVAAPPAVESAKPAPAAARSPVPAKDLATLEREIKATNSQVGELEKDVARLTKEVEMKSKQIATLEKKEAAKTAQSPAKPETPKR